jgi:hypothetical protein
MIKNKIVWLWFGNVLTCIVLLSSCAVRAKTEAIIGHDRFYVTIILAPGTDQTALNSALSECMNSKADSENCRTELSFQGYNQTSHTLSFIGNNLAVMQNLRLCLLTEGVPVQNFLIQKLD